MRDILIKAYGWLEIPATKTHHTCQGESHSETQDACQNACPYNLQGDSQGESQGDLQDKSQGDSQKIQGKSQDKSATSQGEPHSTLQGDFQNNTLEDCLSALHKLCREWYLEESVFSLEDNILQISYEGDYFPYEEVAKILAKYVSQTSKGKLDYIDLEAWTLQRFFLDAEHN